MATKESIIRIRAAKRRDSADPTPSTGATEVTIPGCIVVPLINTGEQTFAGQVVNADFFVKAPRGTDLLATDRVRIRGDVCEVRGVPGDFGRKGVLFNAQRTGTA